MDREELFYTLAIKLSKGIGNVLTRKIISEAGSAKKAVKDSDELINENPKLKKILSKINTDSLKKAEKELKFIENNDIKVLSFFDSNYPTFLKNCNDSPFLLYSKGNISFENKPIISIVGTRNMTKYGRDFCEDFISDLKKYDPIIVSGMAYGVDICAHKFAVANGLQTIGVFAHGLDRIYPKEHSKYVKSICENGGFITEFESGTEPIRQNFPKRNRIIAGLSEATIVVEATIRGGAIITAKIANDYNREVFSVPGKVSDNYSSGCNFLIKTNQSRLLTSVKDLEYILNWKQNNIKKNHKNNTIKDYSKLSGNEKTIINLLKNEPKNIDLLSNESGISINILASTLLSLEIINIVESLPGKKFALKK